MAADPVLLTLLVGLGLTRVQHGADRDPARQAGPARRSAPPTRAALAGRALRASDRRPTSNSALAEFLARPGPADETGPSTTAVTREGDDDEP